MDLKLALSPDADDSFMLYALETGKIDTGDLNFEFIRGDIETLNQKCLKGTYHVSAMSFHAYAELGEKYSLLTVGASVGENYGPVLVATKAMKPRQLKNKLIYIPGKMTTAFLALKMVEPTVAYTVKPFDQILDLVASEKGGEKPALGLLIHEGQVNYGEKGLHKVVDLGEWWFKETKLPLPLGANAIRKDLPIEVQKKVAGLLRESILYAIEHRKEAVEYALSKSTALEGEKGDQYIGMYVNKWSVDLTPRGKKAAQKLMNRAFEEGLIKDKVRLQWVSPVDSIDVDTITFPELVIPSQEETPIEPMTSIEPEPVVTEGTDNPEDPTPGAA